MPGAYLPSEYLPVLVFMIVAVGFGLGLLVFGYLLRPIRKYREKLMPYESGLDPVGEPRVRFAIRYYVIAMLFVVFDVEAVFLYPWAVVFDKLGLFAFVEMMVFLFILLVGYVYAWGKDAFTWE